MNTKRAFELSQVFGLRITVILWMAISTACVLQLCSAPPAHAQVMINKGATIVTKPGSIVIVNGAYQNSTGSIDDSGTVTVTTDFTNNTPATAGGSGFYYIGGHFTNDGTFVRKTGTVVLNGAANQNVGGTSITTFYDLQFTNGGSKTLTQKEIVDSNCYFTNGVCYTTQANVLNFTINGNWINNAGLPTSAAGSYVSGPCEKDMNTTNLFWYPVGKGGRGNTCSITPQTATASTFRTEYFNFPYVNTTSIQSPLLTVSKIHYWHGDIVSGGTDARIKLYWIPGDYSNSVFMNSISNLVVARWDTLAPVVPGPTPAWVTAGVSNVDPAATYVSGWIQSEWVTAVKYGNITTNRPFTIASLTADNTLPVEMGPFTVKQVRDHVELDWLTYSEFQNLGFEVERRHVGSSALLIKSFETDSTLLAKSPWGATYSTTDDEDLAEGDYIYELFQVDVNGFRTRVGSREIAVARPQLAQASSFALYPNPASSEARIELRVAGSDKVSIRIFDVTGKEMLLVTDQSFAIGSHVIPIDVSSLPSGAYNVLCTIGSQRITQTLVVRR